MTDAKLEQRPADVEKELARLRTQVEQISGKTPWSERIAGTFHNDRPYQEAMKLGRQFRQCQKPIRSKSSGQS